jgi:hypothetical protein
MIYILDRNKKIIAKRLGWRISLHLLRLTGVFRLTDHSRQIRHQVIE